MGSRRSPSVLRLLALVFVLVGVVLAPLPALAQVPPLPPPLGPEPPPPEEEPPPPDQQPPPEQQDERTPPPPPRYPPPPPNSGEGRRIVYANGAQRVWLVEQDGTVARSHLVSGRRGMPKPGTYGVFSRSRWSTSGSLRLEYMVRFARGRSLDIGFHAIPIDRRGRPIQSESELGQYRSHGCVRQARADAAFLWDWAPLGTKVVVLR